MPQNRFERLASLVEADLTSLPELAETAIVENQQLPDTKATPLSNPPAMQLAELTNKLHQTNLKDTSLQLNPPADMKRGEPGNAINGYILWSSVSKFPYRFITQSRRNEIVQKFWDGGKIWSQGWDLFYVWTFDETPKPIILVTEVQFQELLDRINLSWGSVVVGITNAMREAGFVMMFQDHSRLIPRYMGRSHSKEEHTNIEHSALPVDFLSTHEKKSPALSNVLRQAFSDMVNQAINYSKGGFAAKDRRRAEQQTRYDAAVRSLSKVQQYLGLRQRPDSKSSEPSGIMLDDLVSSKKSILDLSVVLIAVDLEACEQNHNAITEIGISVLDTIDLIGIPAGDKGVHWKKKIRSKHFRIDEYRNYRHQIWLSGNPDGFEPEFGTSEFISLKEAPSIVAECFRLDVPKWPVPLDRHQVGCLSLHPSGKRNIVLVGHDIEHDIKYLQKLGYNPKNLPNLIDIVDTATLYKAWKHESQKKSLKGILSEFDITAWGLHNAGNDARYTLECAVMIAMAAANTNLGAKGTEMKLLETERVETIFHELGCIEMEFR